MDYRTLRYIITVAEEKNISKAAQKLYLSQPSLSHCILKQERRLGVTLFDRSKHPLRLTYAGERYIQAAQQILNVKEQLEKEMEDIANTKKGRVIVGVTKPQSAYLLPQVISRFKSLYPNVEIVLFETVGFELESLLVAGKTDIAILFIPAQSEHLCYRHLYDEEILLCLPDGHPVAERYKTDGVDLRLLEGEPFILYKNGLRVRRVSDLLFAESGYVPQVMLESQTAETILNLVSAGMGCAFLPKLVVKHSGLSHKPVCFTVGTPPAASSFAFAWRRDSYVGWAAQEFMKITRDVLDEGEFQKSGNAEAKSGLHEFRIYDATPGNSFRPE